VVAESARARYDMERNWKGRKNYRKTPPS